MYPCCKRYVQVIKYLIYFYGLLFFIHWSRKKIQQHTVVNEFTDQDHNLRTDPLNLLLYGQQENTTSELLDNLQAAFRSSVNDFYKTYYSYLKPRFTNPRYRFLLKGVKASMFEAPCKQKPFLLIQVHSAPANIKRRLAIRFSWGQQNNRINAGHFASNLTYLTVFIIGKSYAKHVNHALLYEANAYKDIVLANFIDNYRFLTNKTMRLFDWANDKCQSKYILKTDDDCYVNVANIFDFLEGYHGKDLYAGRVQWIMPANRDTTSKFYISYENFKQFLLPPYVSGGGYIISGNLIPKLLNVSKYTLAIPNEDANVGLLMHALNITPTENTRMLPYIYCNESLWSRPTCDFIHPFVIHGFLNYDQIWVHYHIHVLTKIDGICKQSFKVRHLIGIPLYCPTDNT